MLANICTWYLSAKGKSIYWNSVILCFPILPNKNKQQQEIICNSRCFPNNFFKEDENHRWTEKKKKKICGELSQITKSIS